jgi:Fe-S cluster assembly protein SufD
MSSAATTPADTEPRTLDAILAGIYPSQSATAWLDRPRNAAIDRAKALGLPASTDEEWRYTNPAPILEASYTLPPASEQPADASIEDIAVEHAARLVFIDGRLSAAHSDTDRLPEGVRLAPFDDATDASPGEELPPIVDRALADARDGFEALGAGLLTNGTLVHVARGVTLEKPILIVFYATNAAATLTAPSVTIIAEQNAHAEIIEDHQGADDAAGLTLGRTEIRADTHARVEHTALLREPEARHHVSTVRVIQQTESFARSHRVLLGSAIIRNNIHATIEGHHCESAFNGLFLPENRQHHDNHIRIEHLAPDCHSRQFYRGLLADRARGVFTGRIFVKDIAQKTDAIQSNSNLLLSPTASVTAKPQLEIYADDVRCTHGATSGMFDEDALFYLRARAVPERTARLLLLHAFAGENIDRIPNEQLRERVRDLIHTRLDAALQRNT